jgi:hypothetical protein
MNIFDETDEIEDYEECEECGIIDEVVEYREEIGVLGRYLCGACYDDARSGMYDD